jgi:hypothetical protein
MSKSNAKKNTFIRDKAAEYSLEDVRLSLVSAMNTCQALENRLSEALAYLDLTSATLERDND